MSYVNRRLCIYIVCIYIMYLHCTVPTTHVGQNKLPKLVWCQPQFIDNYHQSLVYEGFNNFSYWDYSIGTI